MIQLRHETQRKLDLIFLLTQKEFTLKYKRTVLGIFWSLLNPVLSAAIYWVAFKIFMRFKVENYTFFLLSALFPWNWFLSSVLISARSLVDNVTLIKKVIFPRHYLVASVILSQLFHMVFSIPILLIFSYANAQGPSASWLLGIPLLIGIQATFTFGLSLIISICNSYFRDIEYLVGVAMNLVFWMTPIIYPMDSVPQRFSHFFLLNPLTTIMLSWRELFLKNHIPWDMMAISLGMALLFLFFGIFFFRKLERRLDEVI